MQGIDFYFRSGCIANENDGLKIAAYFNILAERGLFQRLKYA